jgi:hypothetical protein
MVARQIVIALRDRDPRISALAAVHSTTRGIPSEDFRAQLVHLAINTNYDLVRFAVAAAILGLPEGERPSPMVFNAALANVEQFLKEGVFLTFPALVDRVKNGDVGDLDQSQQLLWMVRLAVYYGIVYSLF